MGRPHRIWVVDDDPEVRALLTTYLQDQGYAVRTLADAAQLKARLDGQLGGERPDLLVLDVMLPGEDGLTLLRRLRDGGDGLPVLMLTARADGVDRIIGLEQGADDYLAKPFLPRELTARIEAILRRRSLPPSGSPQPEGASIQFGDYTVNLATRELKREGGLLPITSGEFALLAVFVAHPQRPLSRERLIELARGPTSETESRSMDVQISRLRKLIEPDPARPRYVQTVWGYGYVFVPDGRPRQS
jgi:two-component system phosphate regulon response regulator OmpR